MLATLLAAVPTIHSKFRIPSNNSTLAVRQLVATHFASCELHKLRSPSGSVIDDWVMFGERSHVNVLVRSREGKFVLFRQHKYALKGESLAPVGGFIEDGETPLDAAKRELHEELSLRSLRWTPLGSFVTSANRHGGRLHTFFADECVPSRRTGASVGDAEAQQVVLLDRGELLAALSDGRFQEVKWVVTVAVALLRLT